MAFVFLRIPHETARLLERIEVPGEKHAASEMHITLLYMGKSVPLVEVAKAMLACRDVVSKSPPFLVSINKVSSFPPNPDDGVPVICRIESPELMAFRAELAANFDKFGINYSKKFEYNPHVTLSYIKDPNLQATTLDVPLAQSLSWSMSELTIWSGDRDEGSAEIVMPLAFSPIEKIASRLANVVGSVK